MIVAAAYLLVLAHPGPMFRDGSGDLTSYEKLKQGAADSYVLDTLIPRSSFQRGPQVPTA